MIHLNDLKLQSLICVSTFASVDRRQQQMRMLFPEYFGLFQFFSSSSRSVCKKVEIEKRTQERTNEKKFHT